jgi:hypothetical protein
MALTYAPDKCLGITSDRGLVMPRIDTGFVVPTPTAAFASARPRHCTQKRSVRKKRSVIKSSTGSQCMTRIGCAADMHPSSDQATCTIKALPARTRITRRMVDVCQC